MRLLPKIILTSGIVFLTALSPAMRSEAAAALDVPSSAAALTEPLSCIDKVDTPSSPLFHGCFDWHSAVHGHYALYAATRLTGDQQYAAAADASLDPSKMAAELQYMKSTVSASTTDNPYGFSWLLLTAQEREQTTGKTDLRPLADYAATQVAAKLPAMSAMAPNYRSGAWAAIRLYQWGVYTQNASLTNTAKSYITKVVKPKAQTCTVSAYSPEFFQGCLMSLAAVATVEGSAAAPLLKARTGAYVLPYLNPATLTTHQLALNFTNSYALAIIAKASSNQAQLDNARQVTSQAVSESWVWNSDYVNRSHWIAQTGILALGQLG